ncbi:MAG: hypothetical protein ACRC6R_05990 [Bacteroidales bacterium]
MFKVGDKVRRKQSPTSYSNLWKAKCIELGLDPKGVFVVTGTVDESGVFLEGTGSYSFSSKYFKKVEPVKPAKEEQSVKETKLTVYLTRVNARPVVYKNASYSLRAGCLFIESKTGNALYAEGKWESVKMGVVNNV